MSWVALAAAALPYVMSAFQDDPKKPGAPRPTQMTDRSAQVNQMLDLAYNPDNKVWSMASDHAVDQVNRALGRRGGLGTSLGMQLQGNAQAQIAQAWLENQSKRQAEALNTAVGYDRAQAGLAGDNEKMRFDYEMNNYKDAQQRNANQVQGVSNMVNAGLGYYNQQQMMDRYDYMTGYNQGKPSGGPGVYVNGAQANYGTPGGPAYSQPAYQMMPASMYDPYNPGRG